MDLVKRAKKYAVKWHGKDTYGPDLPYIYHLEKVVGVLERFGYKDEVLIAAAYLHDVVEDTDYTVDDVCDKLGYSVARIVDDVSDAGDATMSRNERKALTYPRIRGRKESTIVKLADRIANFEACINGWEKKGIEKCFRKMSKYVNEYKHFHHELYFENMAEELWDHLADLVYNAKQHLKEADDS